jgi:O-antigen ligase
MRIARTALLVLAAALPVSIALTEAALITGLVALVTARVQGRQWRSERSWLWPASLALVAAWLLASLTSPAPVASLFHARKLYALGLIALAAEALAEPGLRRRLTPLLLAGATLTAVAGFLIYAVQVQRDPGYRLQSLLSNQMTSGGVLAACALWGLGALTVGPLRARLLHAAALAPVLAALALTQTRSHWLGFACGALVLLLARVPRAWWTVPVAAAAFALAAPRALTARLASIVDPGEPGNQGRISMWRSGLEIWRERPWSGAGVQDLLTLYRQYKRADATFESGHFHNNLVQFAVSSGVVGLAAFVAWTVAGFHQLLRGLRAATGPDRGLAASALGVFVALQVAGQFDFTFGDAEVVYQSYLALGLALALASERGAAGTPHA